MKTLNREELQGLVGKMTLAEIAMHYGICYSTLRRNLDMYGIQYKFKSIDLEKLKQMLGKMPVCDIAKHFGLKQRAVFEFMSKHGLKSDYVLHRKGEGEIIISNWKQDGLRKLIKVNGRWIQYARFVLEQKNGPLPKHICIKYRDNDPMNCDIDNLYFVSIQSNSSHIWENPTIDQAKNNIRSKNPSLTIDDIPEELAEIKLLQWKVKRELQTKLYANR